MPLAVAFSTRRCPKLGSDCPFVRAAGPAWAIQRDKRCSSGLTTSTITSKAFASLALAQDACSTDANCAAVYERKCATVSVYTLCGEQKLSSASTAWIKARRKCNSTMGTYSSLSDAQSRCRANARCQGVLEPRCNSRGGNYSLCASVSGPYRVAYPQDCLYTSKCTEDVHLRPSSKTTARLCWASRTALACHVKLLAQSAIVPQKMPPGRFRAMRGQLPAHCRIAVRLSDACGSLSAAFDKTDCECEW